MESLQSIFVIFIICDQLFQLYQFLSKIQYYTDGTASYKFEKGITKKISSNVKYEKTRILVSRSHLDENTKKLIKNIKNSKIMKVGSSLKFVLYLKAKLIYILDMEKQWNGIQHQVMQFLKMQEEKL